jgi:lipoic acid synthetase
MSERLRKPDWIRVKIGLTKEYRFVEEVLARKKLNTVCEEARCPNIHECWGRHRTATFMILGDTCTRRCRFCSVKTGKPGAVDWDEPERVAQSTAEMELKHVVVTMVNRDDLDDGGAEVMARTVASIRRAAPDCKIEILTSDMMGRRESIARMLAARPDIMSHNLETVERLTPAIRSRSDYHRSLGFLRTSYELDPGIVTKSSLMLGLGETEAEIEQSMDDLRSAEVSLLNLGQYLQPTPTNLPVLRYWTPDEFAALKETALAKGFIHVESGPLVRSSYHAGEQLEAYNEQRGKGEPRG